MYSVSDLEIFVLTYNRANFLCETLESIVSQTVKGFRVTVLNNGSSDDTIDVVKKFNNHGVCLVSSEVNIGVVANFSRAQQLSTASWVIVFHDDDIMHPNYIENVLDCINEQPNVAALCSTMLETSNMEEKWPEKNMKEIKVLDARTLATVHYHGFPLQFGSIVYRKEYFIKEKLDYKKYGKACDMPFLFSITTNSFAVVFKFPFIKYRTHAGQDLNNLSTAHSFDQLISLQKNYYQLMGCNPFKYSGRIFLIRNFQRLALNYSWMPVKSLSFNRYIGYSLRNKSTNVFAMLVGMGFYIIRCLLVGFVKRRK